MTLSDVSTTEELEEQLTRLEPEDWQNDAPEDEDATIERVKRILAE